MKLECKALNLLWKIILWEQWVTLINKLFLKYANRNIPPLSCICLASELYKWRAMHARNFPNCDWRKQRKHNHQSNRLFWIHWNDSSRRRLFKHRYVQYKLGSSASTICSCLYWECIRNSYMVKGLNIFNLYIYSLYQWGIIQYWWKSIRCTCFQ